MSAATKRNAALEGCEHGATEQGTTDKVVNYRSTGDTSTGATIETAPGAKDRRWQDEDRTAWLFAIRAAVRDAAAGSTRLPHTVISVAMSLAEYTDARTGVTFRSYPLIALDTGLSEKTVGTLVRLLEDRSYLKVVSKGYVDKAKRYRLAMPRGGWKPASTLEEKDTVDQEVKGDAVEGGWKPVSTLPASTDSYSRSVSKGASRPVTTNQYTGNSIPDSDSDSELKDDHTRAPDGACSASNLSSDDEPPENDVPPEVRAQWVAEDRERYCNEDHDGEPPIEDMLPDEFDPNLDSPPAPTAAEDYSEGEHVTAAPPAPVEDDDYFPHDLDEAEPEPDRPLGPQVAITEAERMVLRTIVGSVFQDGTDPKRCWVWAYSANPDGETDPFDETGNFARVLASVVRKGLAAVRHNEGTDDEVRITAEGMAVFQEQHGRGGATAAAGTR